MGVLDQSILKARNRNDIVQISLDCSLGKGTIRISESSNRVAGKFRLRDLTCIIGLKTQIIDALLSRFKKVTEKEILEMADNMVARSDEELFDTD
jgi:hypothetical protein